MGVPKKILCFGDSNTWGYNPENKSRFPNSIRWTGRLQTRLEPEYQIIEEGVNGRTTLHSDPLEAYPCGKEDLIPNLKSHSPIDIVILLLGTNDLKVQFDLSAHDIAQGVRTLARMIQTSDYGVNHGATTLFLLAPPPLGKLTELRDRFEGGSEKSLALALHYAEVANELDCPFINLGDHIQSSDRDGIHWEADAHRIVAKTLEEKLRESTERL
jgi:lysophospholipase L1-like esterase